MWVSASDHKFLTIRTLSKMTLIRPSYDASTDALTITAPAPKSGDPGHENEQGNENEKGKEKGSENISITIPAHPSLNWLRSNTTTVDATVWSTTTKAYAYFPSLTAPFNAFFGRDVRLVYKPPFDTSPRPLVSNGAPHILGRPASTISPVCSPSRCSMPSSNACSSRATGWG